MIHQYWRATQITNHGVVPILSLLLNRHLHNLLQHSAITLAPNRLAFLRGTLLGLIMSAIKRNSVIRLFPLGHQLTALPARDIFAKLVAVLIIIPLDYMAPGTLAMAQDRLQWIQNNIPLLQAHTAGLKQLKLHVKLKDLAIDSMTLLNSGTGPTSINKELVATMGCMLGLRRKHKLIGEYMVASSATMANECANLERIAAIAGRNYIDTFLDVQRRTVEVTVMG